ncbi:MAG: MTAP family purine nucleoside phosphorylase [Candidatus Methanospirareceae archaeon]
MAMGIIGGTSLFDVDFLSGAKEEEIKTKYGSAYVLRLHNVLFIPRHGKKRNIPPHKINHKANIAALKESGVDKIISVTSVGSLKLDIKPKSLVVPHDYIALWNIPTFYDDEIVHITPGLDEGLRRVIIKTANDLGIPIITRGVYFQTTGPRLETRAEIRLIRDYADIVGMNMASEATLAKELDIRYANISTVDNYAHGVIDEELDYKKIVKEASKDRKDLIRLLLKLIEKLS